jgi:hypothetical protein
MNTARSVKETFSSIKSYYILFLLVVTPFVNTFAFIGVPFPVLQPLDISRYTNYVALVLGSVLLFKKRSLSVNTHALYICIVITIMLVLNYLLTRFASFKWLTNWIGFLLISLTLVTVLCSLTDNQIAAISRSLIKLLVPLIVILSGLFLLVWFLRFNVLISYLSNSQLNSVIGILTSELGFEKQSLGTMMGLTVFFVFSGWTKFSNFERFLLILSLLIFFPAIIGIRTLILGMLLFLIFVFFTRLVIFRFVAAPLLLLFSLVVFSYWQEILPILDQNFDRLPSLKFAWSAMTENWLGLGNGGYHLYVEQFNDEILYTYGSDLMIRTGGFWKAPESDLVYFIASWGILSIVFFTGLGWLLMKLSRIAYNWYHLYPLERLIVCMSCFLIFSGISQDNAGSLVWWTFVSSGFALVLRHSMLLKFPALHNRNMN